MDRGARLTEVAGGAAACRLLPPVRSSPAPHTQVLSPRPRPARCQEPAARSRAGPRPPFSGRQHSLLLAQARPLPSSLLPPLPPLQVQGGRAPHGCRQSPWVSLGAVRSPGRLCASSGASWEGREANANPEVWGRSRVSARRAEAGAEEGVGVPVRACVRACVPPVQTWRPARGRLAGVAGQ